MDSKSKYLKYKMKYLTLKKSLDKVRDQKGAGRSFNNYMVRQHCCTVPTQYVRRMCNESMQHSVLSTASSMFNYAASTVGTLASGIMGTPRLSLGTGGSILDGIVEIMHESNKDKQNRIRHTLQILDAGNKKPISDHVGLNLTIENDPLNFNIISYNLEGLCPNNTNHRERIENLRTQLIPLLTPNTIMVCQELVLKEQAKEKITKTRHTEIIKRLLSKGNVFEAKVDHTSGIFYNPAVWDVEMLEIKRNTGSGDEDKFSNAFKFVHKDLQYCFIIVNIHLLAPTPERQVEGIGASAASAVGFSTRLTTLEEKQDNELTNIIRKTITHFNNVEPKIPIYLCGDFNRHDANKDVWVRRVIEKLQKEQDEGEFEDVESDGDFEEVEAESFRNPYSGTNKRPAQPPVILPVRQSSADIPWLESEPEPEQPFVPRQPSAQRQSTPPSHWLGKPPVLNESPRNISRIPSQPPSRGPSRGPSREPSGSLSNVPSLGSDFDYEQVLRESSQGSVPSQGSVQDLDNFEY